MKRILLAVAVLCTGMSALAADKVTGLQTEYQTDPVGIEVARPRFGWQMSSDRKGAAQSAYQISVRDRKGKEVWNSGKVSSDNSVAVPYEGPKLAMNHKYSWFVKVWDEKGKALESAEARFTTGLMGSGWNGARWIGSSQPYFSKYRSVFDLSYTFTGQESEFIINRIDESNFISLAVRGGELVVSHTKDGVSACDGRVPLKIISSGRNRVWLAFRAERYMRGTVLTVKVNGHTLAKGLKVAYNPESSAGKGWTRLYGIGFEAGPAVYSDIVVEDGVYGEVLYRASGPFKASDGSRFWSPADESSAPMIRGCIDLPKKPMHAILYSTARGICNFWINGQRVDDGYFTPGSTDYSKSFAYCATDVTGLLRQGANGVGAILGSGWWSGSAGYQSMWQDQFGVSLGLLAKIFVTYEDGSAQVFITDGGWKVWDRGPIYNDGFLNGEDYDARKEIAGWSEADFDDSAWDYVRLLPAMDKGVKLKPYVGDAVRCREVLSAVSVSEPRPGVYVYDMGQNMVGVPSIKFRGKEGQTATIRYGEMKFPDIPPADPILPLTADDYERMKGLVYTENYRSALSTDHYTFRGDADGETFSPLLTFHGYRYVQIEGLDEAPALADVKGLVLNSIGPLTSSFECSDANINRLFSNIQWGQKGNFVSVPTDCPQRDERLGWTGDAQIFARTACCNANVAPFFSRWTESLRETQNYDGSYPDFIPNLYDKSGAKSEATCHNTKSLGWMEVGIILPWQVYQQYGDIDFLQRQWPSMVRYFQYLERRSVAGVQPGGGYGDWLAFEVTSSALTNTAYYAGDALLMSKMAAALGKTGDAQWYAMRYEAIKKAFNKQFVDKDGFTKQSGSVPPYKERKASGSEAAMRISGTQTSYVVPLMFDLFDESVKPLAVKHLLDELEKTDYTLTTGFIGTPYLNLVLSANGHSDVAWKLFEQTACPSWLYPVLQGATTIWERWNSYTIARGFGPVSMNSFNHYSYGAIEDWMMTCALGIERDESCPGYKHFFLQPSPGGTLQFARGGFETPYGRIEAGWKKSGKNYTYEVTVPANTSATLKINGREQELKAGKYKFTIKK